MKSRCQIRITSGSFAFLAVVVLACGIAVAQSANLQGVISGRSGNTLTLRTNSGNVTVVLTPDTQVDEVQGVFHARKKEMAVTALVPGLACEVQGNYNAQNQLVASAVRFKGGDLKTATDIQAGVTPVEQQTQQQQREIAQQQAQLQAQQAELTQEQKEQAAHEAEIAANKAAIAAANKRFGELGDYNIMDEVTVYFDNGKVNIDPQYKPKLLALAQKAKTVTAYTIQVQGYASKVGSAALNQKLSQERATNVINFLEQQGGIPLTSMLAPGAMGTSQQVTPDSTTEGQAENRRVVVRVLQNKGIAGT
ncbi:MAG TPA: OmpA family protein [Candidatus Methylomirabilis sp.]|nr:OmpA family protein [Candidatus Methylomirabilis sp.]